MPTYEFEKWLLSFFDVSTENDWTEMQFSFHREIAKYCLSAWLVTFLAFQMLLDSDVDEIHAKRALKRQWVTFSVLFLYTEQDSHEKSVTQTDFFSFPFPTFPTTFHDGNIHGKQSQDMRSEGITKSKSSIFHEFLCLFMLMPLPLASIREQSYHLMTDTGNFSLQPQVSANYLCL